MEVKPIRDEIAKIDAMLLSIDEELATLNDEPEDMQIVEAEYMGILSALSNAPLTTPAAPFSALMMDMDTPPNQPSNCIILDAFTFFGLIQAFSEDESVMKCMCKIFPSVYGVTITQLEDSLLLIDRISSKQIRSEFVEALLGRVIVELNEHESSDSRKKSALLLIIAKCCDMTNLKTQMLTGLFHHDGFPDWPIGVKIQIAYSAKDGIGKSDLCNFLDSVVEKLDTIETKWVWQLVEMAIEAAHVDSIMKLISPSLISKSTSGPSDVHRLIISLEKLTKFIDVPMNVWQSVVDKLTQSPGMLPVYEIEGTLTALSAVRVSSDMFFQNINTFKKKIAETSKKHFFEIVNFLVLTGDKSPLSIVTKTIMERRDLFVSEHEIDRLISVLLLSIVTSLESGSVIPESILLLKKFSSQIVAFMESNREKTEIIACLFSVLLPSNTAIVFPSVSSLPEIPALMKVESVLELLGHKVDNETVLKNYLIDSIVADYAIPPEKLAIVVERWSVYNCTLNRPTLCGPTALKVNVLATRKNFKVVVVIPELYTEEKSLIQLLSDPIRRLPLTSMNTTLVVNDEQVISSLQHNQRIGRVEFGNNLGVVDIAKFLFAVLRSQVCVAYFDFSSTTCGISDQFITLLMTEFISSYVIRQKLNGTVFDFRNCPNVTASGLGRLVESTNGSTPYRMKSDLDEAGLARLTEQITAMGYTVVTPPAAIPTSSNQIYLG